MIFGLTFVAFLPLSALELTVNKIAAVVNGQMITLHDVRGQTMAELNRRNMSPNDPRADAVMREALETKINDILLREEATRYKIVISDSEIENEITKISKASNLNRKQFEAGLAKQGLSLDTVKEQIRNGLLRQRIMMFMIARKVVVTKEEVADYYAKHKDEFVGGKTVDFSVIIFSTGVKPENIYSQIKSGTISFEDAARKYSRDATSKNGGHVGKIPWGSLPEGFRKLLTTMSAGQLTPIVTIEGAPAVIRFNEMSEGKAQTFEEATPQIENIIREPRLQERFTEYITQLRNKAVVDIRI